MRLLVCGDREWDDYVLIFLKLRALHHKFGIDVVIEGECRGADLMSKRAAESLGIPVEPYPADWTAHGKAAGPIRNVRMLKEGKPDYVVGFHEDLTKSTGTIHMLRIAHKAGKTVEVVPKQEIPY